MFLWPFLLSVFLTFTGQCFALHLNPKRCETCPIPGNYHEHVHPSFGTKIPERGVFEPFPYAPGIIKPGNFPGNKHFYHPNLYPNFVQDVNQIYPQNPYPHFIPNQGQDRNYRNLWNQEVHGRFPGNLPNHGYHHGSVQDMHQPKIRSNPDIENIQIVGRKLLVPKDHVPEVHQQTILPPGFQKLPKNEVSSGFSSGEFQIKPQKKFNTGKFVPELVPEVPKTENISPRIYGKGSQIAPDKSFNSYIHESVMEASKKVLGEKLPEEKFNLLVEEVSKKLLEEKKLLEFLKMDVETFHKEGFHPEDPNKNAREISDLYKNIKEKVMEAFQNLEGVFSSIDPQLEERVIDSVTAGVLTLPLIDCFLQDTGLNLNKGLLNMLIDDVNYFLRKYKGNYGDGVVLGVQIVLEYFDHIKENPELYKRLQESESSSNGSQFPAGRFMIPEVEVDPDYLEDSGNEDHDNLVKYLHFRQPILSRKPALVREHVIPGPIRPPYMERHEAHFPSYLWGDNYHPIFRGAQLDTEDSEGASNEVLKHVPKPSNGRKTKGLYKPGVNFGKPEWMKRATGSSTPPNLEKVPPSNVGDDQPMLPRTLGDVAVLDATEDSSTEPHGNDLNEAEILRNVPRQPKGEAEILRNIPGQPRGEAEILRNVPGQPKGEAEILRNIPGHPRGEAEILRNIPGQPRGGAEILRDIPRQPKGEVEILRKVPGQPRGEAEILRNIPRHPKDEAEILRNIPRQPRGEAEILRNIPRQPRGEAEILRNVPIIEDEVLKNVPRPSKGRTSIGVPETPSSIETDEASIDKNGEGIPKVVPRYFDGIPPTKSLIAQYLIGKGLLKRKFEDVLEDSAELDTEEEPSVYGTGFDPEDEFLKYIPRPAKSKYYRTLPIRRPAWKKRVPKRLTPSYKKRNEAIFPSNIGHDFPMLPRTLGDVAELDTEDSSPEPHGNDPNEAEILRNVPKQTQEEAEILRNVPRQPRGEVDILRNVPRQPRGEADVLRNVPRQPRGEADILRNVPRQTTDEAEILRNVPRQPTGEAEILRNIPRQPRGEADILRNIPRQPRGEAKILRNIPGQPRGEADILRNIPRQPRGEAEILRNIPRQPKGEAEILRNIPIIEDEVLKYVPRPSKGITINKKPSGEKIVPDTPSSIETDEAGDETPGVVPRYYGGALPQTQGLIAQYLIGKGLVKRRTADGLEEEVLNPEEEPRFYGNGFDPNDISVPEDEILKYIPRPASSKYHRTIPIRRLAWKKRVPKRLTPSYKKRKEAIFPSNIGHDFPILPRTLGDVAELDTEDSSPEQPGNDRNEAEILGNAPRQPRGEAEILRDVPRQPRGEAEILRDVPRQPRGEAEILRDVPRQPRGEAAILRDVPRQPRGEADILRDVPRQPRGEAEILRDVPGQPRGETEILRNIPRQTKGEAEILRNVPIIRDEVLKHDPRFSKDSIIYKKLAGVKIVPDAPSSMETDEASIENNGKVVPRYFDEVLPKTKRLIAQILIQKGLVNPFVRIADDLDVDTIGTSKEDETEILRNIPVPKEGVPIQIKDGKVIHRIFVVTEYPADNKKTSRKVLKPKQGLDSDEMVPRYLDFDTPNYLLPHRQNPLLFSPTGSTSGTNFFHPKKSHANLFHMQQFPKFPLPGRIPSFQTLPLEPFIQRRSLLDSEDMENDEPLPKKEVPKKVAPKNEVDHRFLDLDPPNYLLPNGQNSLMFSPTGSTSGTKFFHPKKSPANLFQMQQLPIFPLPGIIPGFQTFPKNPYITSSYIRNEDLEEGNPKVFKASRKVPKRKKLSHRKFARKYKNPHFQK